MTFNFIPRPSQASLPQAERDAFSILYDVYGETLLQHVFKKLVALRHSRERSRKLAEDIVEKIWSEVWKNRRSLKTPTFSNLLFSEATKHVFRQGPAEGFSEIIYGELDAFCRERGIDLSQIRELKR